MQRRFCSKCTINLNPHLCHDHKCVHANEPSLLMATHCSLLMATRCSCPFTAYVPSLLMALTAHVPHCSCPLTLFISPHCSCPLTAHGHSLLMSPHCLWPLAAHVPPLLMNVPSLLMSNHTAHVPSLLMAPPCSLTMSAKHNKNGKVTI